MHNILISIGLIIVLLMMLYLVIKRNRIIKVKGHDDSFSVIIVLFFAVLFFPVKENLTLYESIRNTLIYLTILFSFGVKRGLSEEGVIKFGYIIPWSSIKNIQITQHLMTTLKVTFFYNDTQRSLLFKNIRLAEVLRFCDGKKVPIQIEKAIEDKIESGGYKPNR